MAGWSPVDMPPLDGRIAIVTGASGGLGFEIALGLAGKGASVILAGRSEAKGRDAVARIKAAAPDARVAFELLDLADLASVKAFAARIDAVQPRVAIPVHPGVSKSNLMVNRPRLGGGRSPFQDFINSVVIPLNGQSPARGAEPALFAATSPDAQGAVLWPIRRRRAQGSGRTRQDGARGLDLIIQQRLWDVSDELTGAVWPFPTA